MIWNCMEYMKLYEIIWKMIWNYMKKTMKSYEII